MHLQSSVSLLVFAEAASSLVSLREQDFIRSFQLRICARNAWGECLALLIRIS